MRILFKLLKIMWRNNKALFLLSIVLIIASAVLTIAQAEIGQAFYSALSNETYSAKNSDIKINTNTNINSNNNNNKTNEKNINTNDNNNNKLNKNNNTIPTNNKIKNKINLIDSIKLIIKSKSLSNGIKILMNFHSIRLIIIVGILAFLFYLIYEALLYFQSFSLIYLAFNASISLQKEMFSKLLDLPSLYFKSEGKTGDMISRIMSDINTIRVAILGAFRTIFFTPILIVFGLIMLIKKNAIFTLILVVTGTFGFLIINGISKLLKKVVLEARRKAANTADYINQTIYGIDIIKIFNTKENEELRFSQIIHKYKEVYKKQITIGLFQKPVTELIGAIIVIFIILLGSILIWNYKITMDEIVGFILYLLVITPHIQGLSKILFSLKSAEGASVRIYEILDLENESTHFGKKELKYFNGNVEFKNVYFSYKDILKSNLIKDLETLKNINIKLNKGEFIAIVGPSGAGKTTFVNLIPALIYPTKGEILFDGINYQKYTIESIRKYISYVPQEVVLFPDTIYNNIAYGNPEATKDEVIKFSKLANAHEFILNLPDEYDTVLGERGAKISGGQKQRIAIARALIKNPKILIFDEATSSLDTESEKAIQKAIFNVVKKQTTIVIAHRLSTVLKADKIIVLKDGEIVEVGNHETLLKKGGLYKKLYEIQFK